MFRSSESIEPQDEALLALDRDIALVQHRVEKNLNEKRVAARTASQDFSALELISYLVERNTESTTYEGRQTDEQAQN